MAVAMRVVMAALSSQSDSQPFIHSSEGDDANENGDAQKQVPVGLYHHKADMVVSIFADEDFGKEMK